LDKELNEQKNIVRSRVDYKVAELLSNRFSEEVEFIKHDVKLPNGKKDGGDVDSLFYGIKNHYLVERKRNAGGIDNADSLLKQIKKTTENYKKSIYYKNSVSIINIFFAEAGDSRLFDTLRMNNVYVLEDNMSLLPPKGQSITSTLFSSSS